MMFKRGFLSRFLTETVNSFKTHAHEIFGHVSVFLDVWYNRTMLLVIL